MPDQIKIILKYNTWRLNIVILFSCKIFIVSFLFLPNSHVPIAPIFHTWRTQDSGFQREADIPMKCHYLVTWELDLWRDSVRENMHSLQAVYQTVCLPQYNGFNLNWLYELAFICNSFNYPANNLITALISHSHYYLRVGISLYFYLNNIKG